MFVKILNVIVGILLINSFYTPWYKFTGVTNISPLDVFNYQLTQPWTVDNIWKTASMVGLIVLGVLMLFTAIFPKIFLAIIKIILATYLTVTHIGYFWGQILQKGSSLDWINLPTTSLGFLMFVLAMIIFIVVLVFSIISSPVKGASKLVGL